MTNQPDPETAVPIGSDPLTEAIRYLEADMERFFAEWPDEPRNSPYALGRMDVIEELRRMAAAAQPLRPASNTWTFEACYDADNDKWHGTGGTYSDYAEAKDAFNRRAENDPDHVKHFKFRLVRATTTYTVEAEHTPPPTP